MTTAAQTIGKASDQVDHCRRQTANDRCPHEHSIREMLHISPPWKAPRDCSRGQSLRSQLFLFNLH
jgi:hypothetical protein